VLWDKKISLTDCATAFRDTHKDAEGERTQENRDPFLLNKADIMKTTNASLQTQFEAWVEMFTAALALTDPSKERTDAIIAFCRTFVPLDVTEDDIEHFSTNLIKDTEFAQSMLREIAQCGDGELVETIEGNQRTRAEFTVKPPVGQLTEGSSLDIVRVVAFISSDGFKWTAEVS
jgi:hypothetical protein